MWKGEYLNRFSFNLYEICELNQIRFVRDREGSLFNQPSRVCWLVTATGENNTECALLN